MSDFPCAYDLQFRLYKGLCPSCGADGRLDAWGGARCSQHGSYVLGIHPAPTAKPVLGPPPLFDYTLLQKPVMLLEVADFSNLAFLADAFALTERWGDRRVDRLIMSPITKIELLAIEDTMATKIFDRSMSDQAVPGEVHLWGARFKTDDQAPEGVVIFVGDCFDTETEPAGTTDAGEPNWFSVARKKKV